MKTAAVFILTWLVSTLFFLGSNLLSQNEFDFILWLLFGGSFMMLVFALGFMENDK